MDVSRVQTGPKCSSDFSIERILSDESRVREPASEPPSWLCCTRYQPPRVPRAASSSACRSRRSGRHARVPFTAAQAAALEAAYARAQYLAPPALRALAAALHLRDDRIKIWFQNRRARERREKSARITPPQAVTLPPTTVQLMPTNSWPPNSPQAIRIASRDTPPAFPSTTATLVQNSTTCWPSKDPHSEQHAVATDTPQDLTHASLSVKTNCKDGSTSQSEEEKYIDRPETPLDVETV